MSDAIKRLHYYDHEFLRSTDFTAEQSYHISMRRLHNQVLHTWGVAQGLTLALAGMALTVAPGIAVDSQGREMVIGIPTNLDLTNMAVNTTQYVIIAYAEQTSDHTTETGGEGDTRWTELPVISLAAALPADTSVSLLLGQVTRAQDGSFSVTATNRQKAGTVLPDDLVANSLTLRSATATAAQWPRMTSTGPNQAALNGSLAATGDINGNNVVAAAYLKGAAANVAGTVTCDNVIQNNPAPDLAVKNSVKVGSPALFGSAGSISASGNISSEGNVAAKGNLAANYLSVGPVDYPWKNAGTIFSSGSGAEVDFARRNLTSWPANPAAGDRYTWLSRDGSCAELFTDVTTTLLSVTKDGKVGIGTTNPSASLSVQNGCVSIDGESTGVIVDAQGSKRSGLMKYKGIETMLVGNSSTPAPVRLGRWSGGTIDNPTNFYTDVSLDSNGNLIAQNAVNAGSISVSGGKASISAAGDISASGVVNCDHLVERNPSPISRFGVSQPINCRSGGLPISGSFNTSGGTIVVFATGTGFIWWNWNEQQIGMEIFVDGASRGFAKIMCTPRGANQSFSNFLPIRGLGSGGHSVTLQSWNNTQTDGNCFYSVTIIEFPF